MFRPIACAAALFPLSTAADAAIYRYDVTMALTELSAIVYTLGEGSTDSVLPGMDCEYYADFDDYFCEGAADLRGRQSEIPSVAEYQPSISSVLIMDTLFQPNRPWYDSPQTGHEPICVGSQVICQYTESSYFDDQGSIFANASASPNGFGITAGDGVSFSALISEEGFFFQNDFILDFNLDGNSYTSPSSNGITARYTTTSLDITEIAPISPVPLPAGMALLPSALAFLAWRRRRAAWSSL